MATWPTAEDYKAWARVADDVDDAEIDRALAAANNYVAGRCTLLDPAADAVPPDVIFASLLLTNRLLARRNSPQGIVGSFDGVVAELGSRDPDVWRLLELYSLPGLA